MLRTAVMLLFLGSVVGLLTVGEDGESSQRLAGPGTTLATSTTQAGPATTAPAAPSTTAGGVTSATTATGGTTGTAGSASPTTSVVESGTTVTSSGASAPDALANTGGDGVLGPAVALLGLGLLTRRLQRRA